MRKIETFEYGHKKFRGYIILQAMMLLILNIERVDTKIFIESCTCFCMIFLLKYDK